MHVFHKTRLGGVLALLLAAALLAAGCGAPKDDGDNAPSDSSLPGDLAPDPSDPDSIGLLNLIDINYIAFPERDPGDQSPLVNWRGRYGDDKAVLYVFDEAAQQYTGYRLNRPAEATLCQLALAVGEFMGYAPGDRPLPIKSVRLEKSMAVVDLDRASFLDYFPDESSGSWALASIARTLIENDQFITDVGFTMDGGGQFQTDYLILEDDGYGRYEAPPLYADVSDAEFAALRALAVYPGLEEGRGQWYGFDPFADDQLKKTADAEDLAMLLYQAGNAQVDFEDPAQIPNNVKVEQALSFLPIATTEETYSGTRPHFPQLEPLARSVEDTEITPREWVEQAVRDIYGPEARVLHQTAFKWRWHAKEGVYTPPHMGGWAAWMPYIFAIEEQDGGYRVEFIYSYMGMGGGFGSGAGEWVEPTTPSDTFGALKTDPKFLDFAAGQPRKEAFIQKDGGRLFLRSVKTL